MAKPSTTNNVEIWKDVPGWEGLYQASSFGRIRSLDRTIEATSRWGSPQTYHRAGQVLKLRTDKDGYLGCHLVQQNRSKHVKAHQLVCAAFNGIAPTGFIVAHGNGVRSDNRASNLRWASHRDNHADRIAHGTAPRGQKHPRSKLTLGQVLRLRSASGPEFDAAIAAEAGVTIPAAQKARLGETWRHI